MSSILRINFELISDVIPVVRRDFVMGTRALLDPLNAATLIDGEWMAVGDDYKLRRATVVAGGVGDLGKKAYDDSNTYPIQSFPLFAERGRTDQQALGKTIVLFGGWYEAETRIFDATARAVGGAVDYPAITYVGQPLQVATIVLGGRYLSGLVGATVGEFTTNIPFIVGWVTRLPATNGNKLRFRSQPCR